MTNMGNGMNNDPHDVAEDPSGPPTDGHEEESKRTTIKFKFSIEKVTFEFEGDQATAARMHDQLTDAVSGLQALSGSGFDAGQKRLTGAASPSVADPRPNTRKRRKRVANTSGAPQKGASTPTHNGTPGLVVRLIQEGYFAEERTIGDVRARLSELGHTLKSNEISPTLVRFTQMGYLSRRKDTETNQYVYTKGTTEPAA